MPRLLLFAFNHILVLLNAERMVAAKGGVSVCPHQHNLQPSPHLVDMLFAICYTRIGRDIEPSVARWQWCHAVLLQGVIVLLLADTLSMWWHLCCGYPVVTHR